MRRQAIFLAIISWMVPFAIIQYTSVSYFYNYFSHADSFFAFQELEQKGYILRKLLYRFWRTAPCEVTTSVSLLYPTGWESQIWSRYRPILHSYLNYIDCMFRCVLFERCCSVCDVICKDVCCCYSVYSTLELHLDCTVIWLRLLLLS